MLVVLRAAIGFQGLFYCSCLLEQAQPTAYTVLCYSRADSCCLYPVQQLTAATCQYDGTYFGVSKHPACLCWPCWPWFHSVPMLA
jgi:hypothetical protein